MGTNHRRRLIHAPTWIMGLVSVAALAWSDAHADGKRFALDNPVYTAECGSCHVPYPPALLSAGSWQGVLSGLDKHFGSDASVDAQQLAELRKYLDQNAGRGRRVDATQPGLRITETAWFRHEHDEVPSATWKSGAVKSPANCPACHTAAATGDYSERGIRVPR